VRYAPPVNVTCHGRDWRRAQAGVFALAAAALVAWGAQHAIVQWSGSSFFPLVAVLACLVCIGVFFAASHWFEEPSQALSWDGQQWSLGGQPTQVGLMLQGGSFVLLRLRGAGSVVRWLAVGRGEAATAWHGLLVALRAPQTPGQGS
jgi:hypothetical protein